MDPAESLRVWTMWTLSRRMGDSDSGVRTAAAKALGNQGNEAQSWLGWVARSSNTEARLLACKTLAHPAQSAVGVIPDLLGALQDVDPRVRRAAAESLRAVWLQIGGACDDQMKDRAIEAIRAAIKDPAWDVRRAALWAMDVVNSTKKAVVAEVENATHDRDPRVRAAAALSFFELAPHNPKAVAALRDMIGDPAPSGDDFVQHNHMKNVAIQQMMMSAGESAVLETLMPLITHADAETRSNAIRLLPIPVRPLEPPHAALRKARPRRRRSSARRGRADALDRRRTGKRTRSSLPLWRLRWRDLWRITFN